MRPLPQKKLKNIIKLGKCSPTQVSLKIQRVKNLCKSKVLKIHNNFFRERSSRFSFGGVTRILNPHENLVCKGSSQRNLSEMNLPIYEQSEMSQASKQNCISLSQSSTVNSLDTLSKSLPTDDYNPTHKNIHERNTLNDQRLWESEVRRRRSLNYPEATNDTLKQSKVRFSDSMLLPNSRFFQKGKGQGFKLDPNFSEYIQRETYYHPGAYLDDSGYFETEQISCFNSVKGNIGPIKKKWLWRLLAITSVMVTLFYLSTLLPSYLNGQRAPIIFPVEESVSQSQILETDALQWKLGDQEVNNVSATTIIMGNISERGKLEIKEKYSEKRIIG